jgi:hypothetical protein
MGDLDRFVTAWRFLDESSMTTLLYRRRAADCLRTSQETDDPKARAELLAMAMAWAELAQLAERGTTHDDDTRHDSEAMVVMERDLAPANLEALFSGVGVGLQAQHSDLLCGDIPDRITELLNRLDQPTESAPLSPRT